MQFRANLTRIACSRAVEIVAAVACVEALKFAKGARMLTITVIVRMSARKVYSANWRRKNK